jgi:hypothetical protein
MTDNVLDLNQKISVKRRHFVLAESLMPYINQLFMEAGVANKVDPKALVFPVYLPEAITPQLSHTVLCDDMMGKYPLHFAMLGVAAAYETLLAGAVKETGMPLEEFKDTPLVVARDAIHAYTMAAMIMNFLTASNFLDTKLMLVLNEQTGKVEVWGLDKQEAGD